MSGSGLRLREAIRGIVDYSLGNIQRHIAAKTASAGLASTVPSSTPVQQPEPQPQHQQQAVAGANGYYHAANGDVTSIAAHTYPINNQPMQPQDQTYQSEQSFYPDPQTTSMPPYASASLQAYNNGHAYTPDAGDLKPNIEAQLNAELQYSNAQHAQQQQPPQQPTPPSFPPHQQQQQQPPPHPFTPRAPPQAGPTAWRNFTEGVMTNMPSHGSDYAQTLMALQNPGSQAAKDGSAGNNGEMHSASQLTMAALGGLQIPVQGGLGGAGAEGQQAWPLIHYGGPNGT